MKSRTIGLTLTDPRKYEPLLAIRNEREYDAAVARLNELVDEVGDKPRGLRYRFVETLSVLIEAYDEKHHKIPDASGVELLKFLMNQHELSQGDLPKVGSQGVVSEILRGKRDLNVRQIQALSRRFNPRRGILFGAATQTRGCLSVLDLQRRENDPRDWDDGGFRCVTPKDPSCSREAGAAEAVARSDLRPPVEDPSRLVRGRSP